MSHEQGSNDDKGVIDSYKEALRQRVGADIFQAWFVVGVSYIYVTESERIVVQAHRQFTLDRLRRNFVREMRAAAAAITNRLQVELRLASPPEQIDLPLSDVDAPERCVTHGETEKPTQSLSTSSSLEGVEPSGSTKRNRRRRLSDGWTQPTLPNMPEEIGYPVDRIEPEICVAQEAPESKRLSEDASGHKSIGSDKGAGSSTTSGQKSDRSKSPGRPLALETFITGKCNQLARTAVDMVCDSPKAATPLFLAGPPGVGKTHLLMSLSRVLRRRHRMRNVVYVSAEEFTNDFIRSIADHSLPSFRSRFREVDALLVDDVQFLSANKKATVGEMLYNLQWLTERGKPVVFAASHVPNEISGLSQQLAGRMAAGLVCMMQSLDFATRRALLDEYVRGWCRFPIPDEIADEISTVLAGDGRRILGVVRLIAALQQMYDRMPTWIEIREAAGDLLRSDSLGVTLSHIETVVAEVFHLEDSVLQSKSQARRATEPRMLAMYLSRELTPAAYTEIGKHFGGRSHSAAILAVQRVEDWLNSGKTIGRGPFAMTAKQAIDRIESQLRAS